MCPWVGLSPAASRSPWAAPGLLTVRWLMAPSGPQHVHSRHCGTNTSTITDALQGSAPQKDSDTGPGFRVLPVETVCLGHTSLPPCLPSPLSCPSTLADKIHNFNSFKVHSSLHLVPLLCCVTTPSVWFGVLHHPKRNPVPTEQQPPPAPSCLLSITMDLLILDNPYKWDHTTCDLFYVDSLSVAFRGLFML